MNRILRCLTVISVMASAFLIYLPSPAAAFYSTTTVIGYAIPDATHLGYGVFLFIMPIAILALFLGLARGMDIGGPSGSFLIRFALLIGSLLGMLSLTASPLNYVPIAFPVVSALYVLTYLWKGT